MKNKLIFVDIDGTICTNTNGNYEIAKPIKENIDKINKLYEAGNNIIYWTARGTTTGLDWTLTTRGQLREWGAKYHELLMNNKPHYDLLICDKTKRIEEV
jgi:histidinol phosphatase-like enzyme